MPFASMEPVSFTDLPKPFFQLLLRRIDENAKLRLRSCNKEVLGLVDELSESLFCYVTDSGRESILRVLYVLSRLSSGITTLLLPEVQLVPDVTFPSQAFSRLERLVVNYRQYKLCQQVAAAAGPSLRTVGIVAGRRKCSQWQAKVSKMLQVLQQVQSLHSLHLSLYCTQAIAALVTQLPQLQALHLSASAPGEASSEPEHLLDQKIWNTITESLTALTALRLDLPVLLTPDTAEQLHWPSALRSLQLHMQHSDAEAEPEYEGTAVTGLAAAQLLLHNMPALPHLTQLVVEAHSPNDWFAGPELQLSRQAANSLGQLQQLRSLNLLIGHWQLGLRQLQPLSGCVHLTELALAELVMGFSDEGLDDQMGSRLTPDEAAAVAAGVAAAAAAAGTACQQQQQQQQQGGCRSASSPGSSGAGSSSSGGASVMTVDGLSVQVPLLPQLSSLHCITLWWRLPLVVLAPCLKEVSYKRLRNLGYGSFVLPDLQDWEEAQLPPVFEGLLQGGNAAAAAAAAGPGAAPNQQQPLGGMLGAILAPQGGFLLQNQQQNHIDDALDGNANNDDVAAAAAAEAAIGQPNMVELEQDIDMLLAAALGEAPSEAVHPQQLMPGMPLALAQGEHGGGVQPQQQGHMGYDNAAAILANFDVQLMAAQHVQEAMADLQQQQELAVQPEQQQALVLWHQQQQQQQQVAAGVDGENAPGVWEQLMHWDVDMGGVLADPLQHPAAAAAAAPIAAAAAVNAGQGLAPLPWPHQQQQTAAAGLVGDAFAVTPGSGPGLTDAPMHRAYGDVLRGQRCLEVLDMCVTSLCKVWNCSSSPLATLKSLKLHMLGEVRLAHGGMPMLPQLTALEFYLPDERNWDADYNDFEDYIIWQHQRNVRSIIIRGTFHAGGFFFPGHLEMAHRSMPLVQQLRFVNCGDLQTDRLQQVIHSRLSPVVLVEACGASSSNNRAAAAAAAEAAEHEANEPASLAADAAAAAGVADDDMFDQPDHSADMDGPLPTQHLGLHQRDHDAKLIASDSDTIASSEPAAASGAGECSAPPAPVEEWSRQSAPQLVSRAIVKRMAVGAAAYGVELKWVGALAQWKAWLGEA